MDFTPPPGPPPPKAPMVPEGWKAQYNEQYKEWFYVNIYTKKSQWEMPTAPVYDDNAGPGGPPPGYMGAGTTGDKKHNPFEDHSASPGIESDAALAARLQAEEDARGHGSSSNRTAMQDYQNTPIPGGGSQPSYSQQALPQREEKSKGLFGKLLGKVGGGSSSSSHSYQQQPNYGHQQSYGGGGYGGQPQYQQQGYPQQGYGGYGGQPQYQQQGYGGGGGYGGGYAQPKKSGGGMGMAGGAALGLGGGLVGGMLIADAMEDHDQNEYQQGYDAGQDNGGGGDDFGGGDDGGGDF